MRPTLDYVRRKFDEFNALCFNGDLPPIPLRMSNAGRSLGMFVHPRTWPAWKPRGKGECHMRISTRLDLPEEEVENTIIHEMIHYWIWYKGIRDNGQHGDAFMEKMREINRRHGRKITVRHRSSEEQLATDQHHRNNYICVQHWSDGRMTHNAEISFLLEEEYGILTRCGLHCAPAAHRTLGTFPQGTVRFSPGWFTTPEEVDAAAFAVVEIAGQQAGRKFF